jgi:hypothetical protein
MKRWNGTAWVPYANTVKLSAEMDDATGATLDLDAQNNPVIVWSERDGFAVSHVFYRRFVNGAWQPINGPFLNKPGYSTYATALSLDAQGDPVIAWGENYFNQMTAQVVHVNK